MKKVLYNEEMLEGGKFGTCEKLKDIDVWNTAQVWLL